LATPGMSAVTLFISRSRDAGAIGQIVKPILDACANTFISTTLKSSAWSYKNSSRQYFLFSAADGDFVGSDTYWKRSLCAGSHRSFRGKCHDGR